MDTNDDPLDLGAPDREVAAANKRANNAVKTEIEDIKWLMKNRQGRRIVWRLLGNAGVFQLSFNQTAMTMAFNEGRRSEGLRLFAAVQEHCPDLYVVMTQENKA